MLLHDAYTYTFLTFVLQHPISTTTFVWYKHGPDKLLHLRGPISNRPAHKPHVRTLSLQPLWPFPIVLFRRTKDYMSWHIQYDCIIMGVYPQYHSEYDSSGGGTISKKTKLVSSTITIKVGSEWYIPESQLTVDTVSLFQGTTHNPYVASTCLPSSQASHMRHSFESLRHALWLLVPCYSCRGTRL